MKIFFLFGFLVLFSCTNKQKFHENLRSKYVVLNTKLKLEKEISIDSLKLIFETKILMDSAILVNINFENYCSLNFVLYKKEVFEMLTMDSTSYFLTNWEQSIPFGKIDMNDLPLEIGTPSHVGSEYFNCKLDPYKTGRIHKLNIVNFNLSSNSSSQLYDAIEFYVEPSKENLLIQGVKFIKN